MRLKEYEAKNIFRKYNIVVPQGFVVRKESIDHLEDISYPVMLKAQILAGGRSKAGGIKLANNKDELKKELYNIMDKEILGCKVKEVLIEEKKDVSQELYVSCTILRKDRKYALMISDLGGVDIENQSKSVSIVTIDPLLGLQTYHLKTLLAPFRFEPLVQKKIAELLTSIYNIFLETNANIVEINPVGVSGSNVYALDAKVIIDDSSLFNYELSKPKNDNENSFLGVVHQLGLYGGEGDGNIAVLAGGAGRMMATLDLIVSKGGTIRVFMEFGSLVSQISNLKLAMRKLLPVLYNLQDNLQVKVIFFNDFLVLARCEDFATALIEALNQYRFTKIPIVVRLGGNGETRAQEILKNYSGELLLETNLIKACEKVVMFGKGDVYGYSNK